MIAIKYVTFRGTEKSTFTVEQYGALMAVNYDGVSCEQPYVSAL